MALETWVDENDRNARIGALARIARAEKAQENRSFIMFLDPFHSESSNSSVHYLFRLLDHLFTITSLTR